MGEERQVLFRDLVSLPSTTYATFSLYRYPAKFIPHVIAYVLENYAKPGMSVFDPFAGYGTVGVVSRIYGHNYELWDLNPLLETLHHIATLEPEDVDTKELLDQMKASTDEFTPKWSKLDYWFHPDFLPFLYKAWGFYHTLQNEYLKLIVTIPLLKATRYFSYDDMQRQKLSKSPISKERVKKLLQNDWRQRFYDMVEKETHRVIDGIHDYWTLSPKSVKATVKGGVDTLTMNLAEKKDILITSPPYLQSQEYIRQAKLDLFWLNYPETKIKELGKLEIPYRDLKPEPIYSETYRTLRNKIQEDHLGQLFDRYFWGILGALTKLQKQINTYLFLFVGHSSMRGQSIPIDHVFVEHFTELGWKHETTLVDTIVSRRMFRYSVNPATKQKDNRTLTENLVILKKE